MQEKVNFLIFEKSFLIRQGLVTLINSINQCKIIEEFSDTDTFHSAIKANQPQIVLIGLDLLKNITEKEIKNVKKEHKSK